MNDQTDWAAVRAAYEQSSTTTREIAQRFGVTLERLHAQKRIEGWRPRRPHAQRSHRGKLINRVLRLLETQVSQLEERSAAGKALDASESRLLESMARTIDRLIALDEAERARAPKRLSRVEAAELRKRLADRIMRMAQDDQIES